MHIVKRTCTIVPENGSSDLGQAVSRPLPAFQQLSAYVLLGDPGAGKTTVFEQEASQQDACYVTARDLITFEDLPEWHCKTLFIDGLDEIRAGSSDARTPFDAIRARLDRLGRPRFRLSCREADWFGAADREHLKSVSPDSQVTILHLDPLTESDIVEILNHNPRVPNAEEFIRWAEQRGLNELLVNPQILDMLTKAVTEGNRPSTRKQTFDLACQTIIREHNREHIDATRTQPVDESQQLNAAGFLCAAQLIAGNAGYALTHDMVANDFPYLGDTAYENTDLLHEIARTKLFKTPAEGRITPIHRHVAEYLAARYLAERIDHAGLPIGRILALITGEDGVVVAELRGLSAWLAALCKSHRSAVIERDPLGVVLYGDVQDFTRQEKRCVLDGLQREAVRYPWFRSSHWTASPFGALATPDMEEEFRTILTASDRSETHQSLADCVLDAVSHGARFPSLDNTLLDIVHDATWRPRIRRTALETIRRTGERIADSTGRLKALLEDIRSETVSDPDDDLSGYLLMVLYPQTVTSVEVLDHLHVPKRRNYFGSYLKFWDQQLLDQSSDSDIRILLDELCARTGILQPMLDDYHLRGLTAGLLVRGLEAYGTSIDSLRLYEWLGVALDKYGHPHDGTNTHLDSIRSWLHAHPKIYKTIIGVGLDRCVEKENFQFCMHKVRARLFQSEPPADYGQWCLERMQAEKSEYVARYLLQEAVNAVRYGHGDAGITLKIIEGVSKNKSTHKAWLEDMLVDHGELEEREYVLKRQLRETEEHEKKQAWLNFLKTHETELREGCANVNLLHDLATAYFGYFIDAKGDTPLERLQNFLDHDEGLVQSASAGLRRSLERDDIPEVRDIFKLYVEDQTYLLCRPILAGLEEIARSSPDHVLQLSDQQIRQALAFRLTEGTGDDADWHKSLLASRPDLVAEVMTAYLTAALRGNKQHITGLYALAYIDAYGPVARLSSLAMLNAFPVRSTNQQLMSLDELLKAALRYADRQEFLALINRKLGLRSMNVAQRVHWLAAGLIVAPDQYLQPLAEFTHKQEKRVQHLAGFLADRHDQWSPLDELPIPVLGLLIHLIGGFFAPYTLDGAGSVTPAMSTADFVNRLIRRLGSQHEKEATDTLDNLSKDPGLSRWQAALHHAQFEQRAARREASFRHPDIRQVGEVLNNRSPANSGDLSALTMDVLQETALRIRNGNTDDYRQFWNEGPQRQLDTPKHEDACRDALLSDLQQRLKPLGIDAQPEGHYADDKRADIRVSFGGMDGFEVPVEIKKNTHTNLWYAIHDQLIAKYTREPGAHGFGIYLVFWFGADKTQPPPTGQRPRTAEELEIRLGETLSIDEKRKISICVIDVDKPK
ncbi:MAG: hypothetical protein BMS9Abin08_1212 [Gammaproteobacteria bacterium]|nr:MAG: hypothetical protein BMS9Abin08_1212 [Gammaproteobacteria bacterium]